MMKRNILQVFTDNSLSPPPVWMMRQAGRYLPEYRKLRRMEDDFLAFCKNPELTVEAALQPIRRYRFDAAILFSDILLVPHAMGIPVIFKENIGPVLSVIDQKFKFPREEAVLAKLEVVCEILIKLREKLDAESFADVAIVGFSGAPWTLAAYMLEGRGSRDFLKMRRCVVEQPSFFTDLISYLTSILAKFLSRQSSCGADFLQLFDSWAGLADEVQFNEWIIAPTKKIVDSIKNYSAASCSTGHCPVIGFARQASTRIFSYASETGLDGVSLDSCHDLQLTNSLLSKKIVVQGNLDPVRLLVGGIDLEEEVKRICSQLAERPFIFNLGHGIIKETPPEHVARVVSLLRNGV